MRSYTFGVIVSALAVGGVTAQTVGGRTHQDLVRLYEEFRAFTIPELNGGVPDYTPPAMTRKREGLRELQQRLATLDTTGWSMAERVDYLVVKAEMSGMEFDHRVLRPWTRDPAFYVVINFQFGPKMYGATGLPSLPIAPDRVEAVRQRLRAIPAILAQAQQNLTEPGADLAMLGIRSKNREEGLLGSFVDSLRRHHPALVPQADSALAAVRGFRDWLQQIRPTLRARAGIGANNYTWFMRNVMLLPYSWEELNTIAQRDLDRSLALMTMEEHRNRALPPFDLIDTPEEYRERHVDAQRALLDFLRREGVMTVPDFIQVQPPGGFQTTRPLDYFQNVNYRDPLALLPHDFLVHTPDAQRRSLDTRPIRGARRLYFVDGQRQDGLATAMEQILMNLGSLDGRPRAKELAHNLFALRAVRALSDLKMHGNELSIMEAFQFNIDNTPKGWLPENSSTMWHDLELYLRQPGYGVGYLIGLAQIEQLMAERAKQLGPAFSMKQFMDDFVNAGLIPISLVRWELTGTSAAVVAARPPRERPAMIPCPWPTTAVKAAEPEVSGNQRPRIPDCTPPGWQPPAELAPYEPRPLPADRPK
ncbi:MAG TPA: DUF885 family protein, partial [Longimicrobiales bacterium]|nr:DUF885 family protein [Longimicrobiales bacterium]